MDYPKKGKTAPKTTSVATIMFVRRAITTAIVVPLALWLVTLGSWFYFIPLSLIISLATIEYVTLLGRLHWRLPLAILLPTVLMQLVAGQWPDLELFAPLLFLGMMLSALYALWLYEQRSSDTVPASWMAMAAGILWLGWAGGHFFRLRVLALEWTVLALLITWIADSAAYVFGSRLGKHKLAPRLSPNKTVEGYGAGIVFGVISAGIVALLLELPLPASLLLGFLIPVLSPAGDLAISLIKREAGVKDSGNMLPGHGGALDRIDSLLWSVTLAYYVAVYLG